MKFKVIKVDNRYENVDIEREILNEVNAELEAYNLYDEDRIIEATRDADGIITDLSPITEKVITNLRRCKAISKVGVGVDNIDVQAATSGGIFVCNVPDYCVNEVADHTMALILNVIRKVNFVNNLVREGKWGVDLVKPIQPIDEMTLGLVGFGSIARSVCIKAKAFNFNILVFDPFLNKNIAGQYSIKIVDFDFLLKSSDVVSIHCAANAETRKLFNEETFKKMKSNAYLINSSRGIIIDNKALCNALKEKIIAGAATDVYDPEPISKSDPILKLDNFVITSHYGFYSEKSIREVRIKSALNIAKILSGAMPVNIVNRELIVKKL